MDPARERPALLDMLALAAICVVAGATYVHFARTWHLGYDEAWHVFSSTVQPFRQFVAELRREAHPPLHYVLLRLTVPAPSESVLWPRLVSIIAGIGSVVLTFLCARALRTARPVALLAALAFALAPANVNLAACVRGYELATLFTLLALLFLLRGRREPTDGGRPLGVGFAAAAVAAMASEYSAALAVLCMLAVAAATSFAAGQRPIADRRAVLGLALGSAALGLYRAWTFAPAYAHLPEFFPAPGQSRVRFALDGVARTVSTLLAPLTVAPDRTGTVVLAAAVLATVLLIHRYLAAGSPHRDPARGVVPLVIVLLWPLLFVLSARGLYPFGGRMRHQFVLFPFLLLTLGLMVDELYALARRSGTRALVGVALAVAMVVASRHGLADTPLEEFPPARIWQSQMAAVRAALRPGDAIYVSQYNSVGLFLNMRDWRWAHRARLNRRYDRFTGKRAGERLTVIRDIGRWPAPLPPTATFVRELSTVLALIERDSLWVIALPQTPFDGSLEPLADLCREHGLTLDRQLPLDGGVAFRVVRRCPAQEPLP